MAGYHGFSMSNNAVSAYQDGAMPKSKWTKQAIISAIYEIDPDKALEYSSLKKYQLETLLTYDSWHHTSKYYNTSDFYRIDEEALENSTFFELSQIEKKEQAPELSSETWFAEVQIWGGTRRHPHVIGIETVSGQRKGDWLITPNGRRYKLSANKTLKYWTE